jgi:hypothetical protein
MGLHLLGEARARLRARSGSDLAVRDPARGGGAGCAEERRGLEQLEHAGRVRLARESHPGVRTA